jgi:glycosyltransferase involved in cell wall biosynthesis
MSESKKILLVTRPIAPPWDEASKNFAYYLAKNITSVNFTLLTNGILPDLPSNITQKPIYTSNHLSWMQRLRLLKLVSIKNQFDVMHFMLTPSKVNALGFKNFLCSKSAKTIQTIATLREDLLQDSDYKDILFADLIITYSDYAKNKLESLGFQNVQRIYPGIDLEYYSPELITRNSQPETYNLKNEDFVVTYPGEYTRLGAMDDITDLITQNITLWKEKSIKFLLACRVKNEADAKKKQEVITKLENAGATGNVVLTDTVSDMASLYNLSDVILFPVRDMKGKFDVPLAAIEPMACEKPVIISDLPILQEFANEGNSVIIERGNIAELKEAILSLYADPEKRIALGKSARQFTEANFDIRKVAEKYKEVYEKL